MRAFALLVFALVACGEAPATSGFSSGPPVTTLTYTSAPESSTGEGGSTGTSSTGAVAESTGSAPLPPDMGPPPDFGPDQPAGCKGKIDFVFVISRLFHMEKVQDRLLPSFDGFMATIAEEFPDFDTHIIVANPDNEWPGDDCNTYACDDCNVGEPYDCKSQPSDIYCERRIGAGVLFPAGNYATNHECQLAGGNRYITSEEPDVAAAFKCIASLGAFGGIPSPAEALVEVVSPELNAPGGCNAGFLRPDALLVVTFITNSGDTWEASKDWPFEWYDDVVAAKGGDPDAVVVLSIIAPKKPDPPWNLSGCYYDYDPPANRLYEFTEMFPHHVLASTCEDSYVPAFAAMAAAVKNACAAFIPQ
jgi:hypothetical protein